MDYFLLQNKFNLRKFVVITAYNKERLFIMAVITKKYKSTNDYMIVNSESVPFIQVFNGTAFRYSVKVNICNTFVSNIHLD